MKRQTPEVFSLLHSIEHQTTSSLTFDNMRRISRKYGAARVFSAIQASRAGYGAIQMALDVCELHAAERYEVK